MFLFFFFFLQRENLPRNVFTPMYVYGFMKRGDFKLCIYVLKNSNVFPWPSSSLVLLIITLLKGGRRGSFLEKYSRYSSDYSDRCEIGKKGLRRGGKGRERGVRHCLFDSEFISFFSRRDLARRCLNRARTIRFPGVNKIVPLPHFREIVYTPIQMKLKLLYRILKFTHYSSGWKLPARLVYSPSFPSPRPVSCYAS